MGAKYPALQEYLAIGGDPDFCKLTAQLAFGEDSSVLREGRAITVQSLSGRAGLHLKAHTKKPVATPANPRTALPSHERSIPVSGPISCLPSWQWLPMLVKLIS